MSISRTACVVLIGALTFLCVAQGQLTPQPCSNAKKINQPCCAGAKANIPCNNGNGYCAVTNSGLVCKACEAASWWSWFSDKPCCPGKKCENIFGGTPKAYCSTPTAVGKKPVCETCGVLGLKCCSGAKVNSPCNNIFGIGDVPKGYCKPDGGSLKCILCGQIGFRCCPGAAVGAECSYGEGKCVKSSSPFPICRQK